MRIEEMNIEKLKRISLTELFKLRLCAKQFYEKHLKIEKESFLKVRWESFFEKYGIIMNEFKKRQIEISAWPMDKDYYRNLMLQLNFDIHVLGSYAQLNSPLGRHFSLLVSTDNKKILIDPSVHRAIVEDILKTKEQKDIDGILITQIEEDHYAYLSEYKDVPVYSSGAIIDEIKTKRDFHPLLQPINFDGMIFTLIKTIHKVGVPSIGIRIDVGTLKISILPEFLTLGKLAEDQIKETIWLCGCGDFEKDDEKEGKLSFLSLLELAERLKPKRIYLTNLRKNIIDRKEEVQKHLEKWKGKILYDDDVLNISDFKKLSWKLNKPAYRIFELEDLKNTPHFDKGKAIIEAKFDGVRTKIAKTGSKVEIFTDPEETATPDKTKRLPFQYEELKNISGNFEGDAETIIIEGDEVLHRTAVNALLNGKFDPTELSKKAHIYIFDFLSLDGKDMTSWPLKERKEIFGKFKDTEHIHFVRTLTNLKEDGLSFIVDLEKPEELKIVTDKLMEYSRKGNVYPKFITEGIMVKLLNAPYEEPQSKTMAKWKEKFESDCLVIEKHRIIRDGKKTNVFNYLLAVGDISKEWAKAIFEKDKQAITYFDGKKFIKEPSELIALLE